jgi:hypothetical protein
MNYPMQCNSPSCELCKRRIAELEQALAVYENKLEPAVVEVIAQSERDRVAGELRIERDYVA